MKIKLLILALILSFSLHKLIAQSDSLYINHYNVLENYYTKGVFDYQNESAFWWQSWGWNLLSYIRMYEATNDLKYLDKFLIHSYNIQQRKDSLSPVWNEILDKTPAYKNEVNFLYTGILIRPMAEFVYKIKSTPQLYSQSIDRTNNLTFKTYGEYAEWLQFKVNLTLGYFLDNCWLNSYNCFSKKVLTIKQKKINNTILSKPLKNNSKLPNPCEINFQSSFACALLFISKIDSVNNELYYDKAKNICFYFKTLVKDEYYNDSYVWFHDFDKSLKEDVAHGAMDISFPVISNSLYPDSLFSKEEVLRFANTFSLNIFDRVNNCFHNNVYGTDYDNDPAQVMCSGTISVNGTSNFYSPGEILAWMQIFEYSSGNIFQTLNNHTLNLISNTASQFLPKDYCAGNTKYLSGNQSFYGFSEVVKAYALNYSNKMFKDLTSQYDNNILVTNNSEIDGYIIEQLNVLYNINYSNLNTFLLLDNGLKDALQNSQIEDLICKKNLRIAYVTNNVIIEFINNQKGKVRLCLNDYLLSDEVELFNFKLDRGRYFVILENAYFMKHNNLKIETIDSVKHILIPQANYLK